MFLGLYYSLLCACVCACACACVLLSCEVNGVLWMAWKEGMWVWLAGVFFLFCLLGFSFFILFLFFCFLFFFNLCA